MADGESLQNYVGRPLRGRVCGGLDEQRFENCMRRGSTPTYQYATYRLGGSVLWRRTKDWWFALGFIELDRRFEKTNRATPATAVVFVFIILVMNKVYSFGAMHQLRNHHVLG